MNDSAFPEMGPLPLSELLLRDEEVQQNLEALNNKPYHNYDEHVVGVISTARMLTAEEGHMHDSEILALSGLFHDAGQTEGSKDHEERSAAFAERKLRQYGASEGMISVVKENILATKLLPREKIVEKDGGVMTVSVYQPQPKTRMQEIMCDSDMWPVALENPEEFWEINLKIKAEVNPNATLEEWINGQISFLENMQWYTGYAKENWKEKRQQKIDFLKAKLQPQEPGVV